MTITLILTPILIEINEALDFVRITDQSTGSAKAIDLKTFAKLIRLGIRANLGELP